MFSNLSNGSIRAFPMQTVNAERTRKHPAYSFTMGIFQSFDKPELLVIRPYPEGSIYIAELFMRILDGFMPAPDQQVDLSCGQQLLLKTVEKVRVSRLMKMAVDHYGHKNFPVLELIPQRPAPSSIANVRTIRIR